MQINNICIVLKIVLTQDMTMARIDNNTKSFLFIEIGVLANKWLQIALRRLHILSEFHL